jgi:large subunit ribosomal protein L25
MSKKVEIHATPKEQTGTAHARRGRHQGIVPAIVYGAGKDNVMITMKNNKLIKALTQEAFHSQIIQLNIAGESESVVLKTFQMHPTKPKVIHMDFLRVSSTEALTMTIPLHFTGEEEAPGAKKQGGVISHVITEVEVKCLPADLPQSITLDISKMQLNDALHLSDLPLPTGVELTGYTQGDDTHNQLIVSIHPPRVEADSDATEEGEEAESDQETPADEQTKDNG